MNGSIRVAGVVGVCVMLAASGVMAQDWPQWRGPNRDARATGFNAPQAWPAELTQKWKREVGDGVATPALVDERLYVFTRQQGNEVVRCLDAATGEQRWQYEYQVQGATGPASRFAGPRSSPTVADGKVVTLGVRGDLLCLQAANGNELWRNDEFDSWPRFFTSSSPIVVDGLCVAQLGGRRDGAMVAFELATGSQKWKWTGDGTAYGSPVLMSVGGTKAIIAPTAGNMVAVDASDGSTLWQIPYEQGRYNAATPIVEGQTLIYAGPTRGMTAVKLEKQQDRIVANDLWRNTDLSVGFNTPVLKQGLLYGLTQRNEFLCVNAKDGETAWRASAGGRRRGRGYGSIVDAGTVLFGLTPAAELVVFEPDDKQYKELARYRVAEGRTYAYPVVSGNRVFVKDGDSITLWTIE